MLYLMTVLTFLAAIMFYMLSPRDDKSHLDTYQAEPLIQALVGQHQASKDYLSQWFGAHLSAATGNYFNLQPDGLTEFFPNGIVSMMCSNNAGTAGADYPPVQTDPTSQNGECFISRVVCTNASGALIACNDSLVESNSYVVTYGGWSGTQSNPQRPSWWPKEGESRARRNERWRRAIAQRTHGSLNCGTLYPDPQKVKIYPDNPEKWTWCLDNGQVTQEKRLGGAETRCAKPIPAGVIEGLNVPVVDDDNGRTYLFDMFFCMSPLVLGPAHYYPSGLTHYFDGLDNWNKHAPVSNVSTHKIGEQSWTDLISGNEYAGADMSFSAKSGLFPDAPTPYATLSGSLYFDIAPGSSDFAVSEVLAIEQINNSVNLMTFQNAGGYPRVSVDYEVNTTTVKNLIVLKIEQTDAIYYKFNAEVHLKANQPFTLTLVRTGDEIDLYMGGHETLSENQRKLFSGHLSSETPTGILSARDTFQNAMVTTPPGESSVANKMFIKADNPVRVYAVRSFGRGLNTTDVYKIYKEDLKRYGSAYATNYGSVFYGDIDWPKDDFGIPQKIVEIDRIN